MGGMAGTGLPCPGRVRLIDLIGEDGLPSDRYKDAITVLSQSLARYNCAVIHFPLGDDVLIRCVLDSSRMFFHQRPVPGPDSCQSGDHQDWNRTSGYFAQAHHVHEVYDYRPGYPAEAQNGGELPPVGLPELFVLLGKAARQVLDAIGRSLDLQSFCFTDLLDNVPLRSGECSTSVLSVCCHGRPGVQGGHLAVALCGADQGHMPKFEDHEPHLDKGLLTLVKSDKTGLRIRDVHGQWLLVDGDLGPQDMVVYTGLALYQSTAGYISPAVHRTEAATTHAQMYGRCSISFKLMPRPSAIIHSSAMTAAGHAVAGPFQQPIAVLDFMQRTYPMDQIVSRPGFSNYGFQASVDGAVKIALKRKKQPSRGKPLAPSKRLRLEAQRVLKEKVQEIADSKGIKIRFCSLKDCEEQHISSLDSPCAAVRAQIGWPTGVPFVHPHDLPNKSKQAFLEAYEPGWTASQDGELGLLDSSHSHPDTHAY